MVYDSPRSPNVDWFSVAGSLVDCLFYALRIGETGKLSTIWHAGSLRDLTTPPATFHKMPGGRIASIAEPDIKAFEDHWKRLRSGAKSVEEYRIILAGGSTCWVRDAATPFHDRQGVLVEVVGSVQDITWARASTPPTVDESPLFQAFRQSDTGMAFWDSQDRLLMSNPKFSEFFFPVSAYLEPGLGYREFLARAAAATEIYSGDDREGWIAARCAARPAGEKAVIALPDGRYLEIKEESLGASGRVTLVSDLSAQRRGEQALQRAKELAETANATKSRFLRAANHDIRQPLASLKILIYSCMTEEDEEHRKDLLHAMDISASIMEDILGVLLQVGQLDAGKITPRMTNFQVAPFLERIRIQFEHQAKEKGLDLRVLPSQTTVVSDRALLERVISNFVANAIRYTSRGKILVGCRKCGNSLRIEVHDTGCGISEEHLNTIFEEFYQIPGGHNRRKQGLGLGLSIAQRIAQILDHPLDVRSKPDKGSTFSLDIPLGDVWRSQIDEAEVTEAIGGQFVGTRVLLLEDDEFLRETLANLLARWGIDVRQAANAEEISPLVELDGWTPDLLLADYRLRLGVRGTEVAGLLRKKFDVNLPCIVMTAETEPALIERIKAERFPLLIKPINPPQLRVVMHNLLFEPELLDQGTL
ncbi:MAG: hypothetical protein Kilf2KO_41710 [Rhodospirillales bacterium]